MKSWQLSINKIEQAETGFVREELSGAPFGVYYPYFTQRLFDKQSRYLAVNMHVDNVWQAGVIDLDDLHLHQLTDAAPTSGGCMDPAGQYLYTWQDRTLVRVAIDNGHTDELYHLPDGYAGTTLSISSCGTRLAFAYFEKLPSSTENGKIYSSHFEAMYQCPRSVLMAYDLESMSPMAVYGDTAWYSHISISPRDRDLIMFCHEGPWQFVQRLWVANASNHEVWPIVKQRYNLDRSGHEYFDDQGLVHTQFAKRDSLETDDWKHAHVITDVYGKQESYFWYTGAQAAHVQASHGNSHMLVGDCKVRDIADPGDAQSWMCLLQLQNEAVVETPLCQHNTSWLTQRSHPHPVFSIDDSYVYFNSDASGQECISRVCIKQ